jgi:hypothetical protein
MPKFRKKPVVIDAMQWDGADVNALLSWMRALAQAPDQFSGAAVWNGTELKIVTLEGDMRAERGDWIIRGVAGEFYPCKSDIFAATYEAL